MTLQIPDCYAAAVDAGSRTAHPGDGYSRSIDGGGGGGRLIYDADGTAVTIAGSVMQRQAFDVSDVLLSEAIAAIRD